MIEPFKLRHIPHEKQLWCTFEQQTNTNTSNKVSSIANAGSEKICALKTTNESEWQSEESNKKKPNTTPHRTAQHSTTPNRTEERAIRSVNLSRFYCFVFSVFCRYRKWCCCVASLVILPPFVHVYLVHLKQTSNQTVEKIMEES